MAQEVAREAPPTEATQQLPDLPRAVPLVNEQGTDLLTIEADNQSRYGALARLEGNVVVNFRGHTVRADRITYDETTGDLTLDGHVTVTGGENDEYIQASRGQYNLRDQTGRFYDVSGSVGLHSDRRTSYSTPNPFLFSGRLVVKTGPESYDVYDGRVTSCLLPKPDWQFFAGHFSLDTTKVRARNSTFRLLNVPILFLPYVTHPIAQTRQSGILPPVVSQSSTKGFVFGEEGYLVLGRSADLTIGSQYFSSRGYAESATFRYRGSGNEFLTAHFSALQDRGITLNGFLTNQGGQDVTFAFRRKLSSYTRFVGDAEYLSSYVYREAFNESFNQAVSSDITSIVYAVHQRNGFSTAVRADRYQGLKRVAFTTTDRTGAVISSPGQQVRIFHAPSIDFTALDHHVGSTPLLWSVESSVAGLKRTQPNFISSGIIERFDLRPELSLPLAGAGWHSMASIAVRETVYSRSRAVPYPPGQPPVELVAPISRTSYEFQFDARPPVIERDFRTPRFLSRLLGSEVRHTVEPQLVYRKVGGIDNFLGLLRFDEADVASDTNELQYGVTQRLFARRQKPKAPQPCVDAAGTPLIVPATAEAMEPEIEAPSGLDANGIPMVEAPPVPVRTHARVTGPCDTPAKEAAQQEWLSWKVAQKHFFDPTFGKAIINTRRNIFDTTLSFSGIAFLTEGRDTSPIISRLRARTSSHTDVEWDFDLDTGAKRFTSSNVFVDAHEGPLFGAVAYARLNAPGRFYTEQIDNNNATLVSSATSDFSQLRFLLGYGTPTTPGFSAAANAGLDLKMASLQYASLQANYNWNCCGFSAEYRKYELGSVRNEGTYKFSFTLANIGTAGNLRRAQRLF